MVTKLSVTEREMDGERERARATLRATFSLSHLKSHLVSANVCVQSERKRKRRSGNIHKYWSFAGSEESLACGEIF